MSERPKERDWKSRKRRKAFRGFKSRSLRCLRKVGICGSRFRPRQRPLKLRRSDGGSLSIAERFRISEDGQKLYERVGLLWFEGSYMTELLSLEDVDVDGAIRETGERVESRAGFLKKAGIGVGALAAGSAFAGAIPSVARGAVPQSDIDILNFALTLEYLEAAFYAQANANRVWGSNRELRRFSTVVAQHEGTHVTFLKGVLGAKAVPSPKFDFKDTVTNAAKFAATAQALEDTGVHAYLGQVANIKAKAVLVPAGRIALVEARHAAWIRDLRFSGGTTSPTTPAPGAFEDPFTKAKVLAIVKATGFIVG